MLQDLLLSSCLLHVTSELQAPNRLNDAEHVCKALKLMYSITLQVPASWVVPDHALARDPGRHSHSLHHRIVDDARGPGLGPDHGPRHLGHPGSCSCCACRGPRDRVHHIRPLLFRQS